MALITKEQLNAGSHYLVRRTERGNQIIKTDPRQIPRRLRVLLLAIDGGQPVRLYTQTLRGFGDVAELLVELINLGLVSLAEPATAKQSQGLANSFQDHKSEAYVALEGMLDDSRFNSQQTADMLYGSTSPGSFDDLVRVAQASNPQFEPAKAAPAPVPVPAQREQLESLFNLLDAVRGERKNLKQQLAKLQRVKEAAVRLNYENKRLQQTIYTLCAICAGLALWVGVLLFKR
jgi:hypothetical protein